MTHADSKQKPGSPGRWPLHAQILIGLLIGGTLGLAANFWGHVAADAPQAAALDANDNGLRDGLDTLLVFVEPVGKVFLRLVLMVVVPLVVSALILGVLELGQVQQLGRVGLYTLLLTLALSTASVVLGVGLVNLWRPGESLTEAQRTQLIEQFAQGAADAQAKAEQAKSLGQVLLDLLPENPLQEMVGAVDGSSKGNGMLAVMCFALLFGWAISQVESARRAGLVNVLEGVFDATMHVIGLAMRLAPYAVGCLMFVLATRLGLPLLSTLLRYVLTVLGGLALHLVAVYSFVLVAVARRSPWQFFRQIREAMLTALGTSSSNATLPTALRVAEENLHLPRSVSRFVLTIGATGNQNGTALYEGVTVLFLAQVFGVELSLTQQLTVVVMCILAGIGTAGVPGGSLPLVVIVMRSVGVPAEGIALILGVDRILDMARTTLNVTGDLVLAACVARVAPVDQPGGGRP